MAMTSENLSTERSQDYDKYRKKFSYLIICKDCQRSFDVKKDKSEDTRCRSCASENVIIKGKSIFRYYCPSCEKHFISEEEHDVCKKCGTHYLHMMRIKDLTDSDRFEIQKAKLKQMLQFHKKEGIKIEKIKTKIIKQVNRLNTTKFKQKDKPVNKAAKRFSFSRNKEEMPTY